MYVLGILKEARNADAEPAYAAEHQAFIGSLIKRNAVLLGGSFADVIDDASAAYLLRCADLDEARRIAAKDPYVVNEVVRPRCVAWELVGINPDAIDDSAVIRSEDV